MLPQVLLWLLLSIAGILPVPLTFGSAAIGPAAVDKPYIMAHERVQRDPKSAAPAAVVAAAGDGGRISSSSSNNNNNNNNIGNIVPKVARSVDHHELLAKAYKQGRREALKELAESKRHAREQNQGPRRPESDAEKGSAMSALSPLSLASGRGYKETRDNMAAAAADQLRRILANAADASDNRALLGPVQDRLRLAEPHPEGQVAQETPDVRTQKTATTKNENTSRRDFTPLQAASNRSVAASYGGDTSNDTSNVRPKLNAGNMFASIMKKASLTPRGYWLLERALRYDSEAEVVALEDSDDEVLWMDIEFMNEIVAADVKPHIRQHKPLRDDIMVLVPIVWAALPLILMWTVLSYLRITQNA